MLQKQDSSPVPAMHTKETKQDEEKKNKIPENHASLTQPEECLSAESCSALRLLHLNECKSYSLFESVRTNKREENRTWRNPQMGKPHSDLQLWKIPQSGWKRPLKNCMQGFSLKASTFKHLRLCYWSRCCNRWGAGLGVFLLPIAALRGDSGSGGNWREGRRRGLRARDAPTIAGFHYPAAETRHGGSSSTACAGGSLRAAPAALAERCGSSGEVCEFK